MAIAAWRSLDFLGSSRILNLPSPGSAAEPATRGYVDALVEGIKWKSARAGSAANINLASPGGIIGGVTMVAGDRSLQRGQTAGAENGLYIWNGPTVAMTRAPEADTFAELEAAVVTIEEGTDAGTSWRQTEVNGTLGTSAVTFVAFGTAAPPASTTTPGLIEIATQAEVDAATLADVTVTPATLGASPHAAKRYATLFGDGTATSYSITHNLNSRDVQVKINRNSGNYDEVLMEVQYTTVNSITLVADAAVGLNAFSVAVKL